MCIAVFLWQSHPLYPFLLLLNRDEYYSRPTKPLGWWENGEIVGGRDEVGGGTWFGCTKHGKSAFLTNFREIQSIPTAKSRGDLPVRFLKSEMNPMEFAEAIVNEGDAYNGFNLVLTDIVSKTMVYVTNRPDENGKCIRVVSPGIHVLSNANLDTPWFKAQRLSRNFREMVDTYGVCEIPMSDMVEKLMRNAVKDEEEEKLPNIYPAEVEYELSSIFIETKRPSGHYGTRSMSALSVKSNGDVFLYEKHLDNNSWKEQTVRYNINKDDEVIGS